MVNGYSKVAHRTAVGPGGGVAATWIAACGWRFGASLYADVISGAELPADYRVICA